MEAYIIRLNHKFPTLNELMTVSSYHKRRKFEKSSKDAIREALYGYDKPEGFTIMNIEYVYSYKRRDVDNTIPAVKYFLDVLREQGWLIDDSPRYVQEVILKFDPEIEINTQFFKLKFK